MTATLRYEAKFQLDEVPALLLDLVANPTLQHRVTYSGYTGTLDGSSTVAIDDGYSDTRALTAGAYTLNLAALTSSTLSTTKDFTGKKVKGIIIIGDPANTAGIVVKDGASNPYLIWGTSTGENTVWPGFPIMQIFGNNLTAISSTVKTIDFSSADTDAAFQIALVVGT